MGRSIAIVEDEPLIRANYVEALTRFGYETRGYGSRQEASGAFAMRLPELVINDIGLGDEPEGGFDLCRELRAKSANAGDQLELSCRPKSDGCGSPVGSGLTA